MHQFLSPAGSNHHLIEASTKTDEISSHTTHYAGFVSVSQISNKFGMTVVRIQDYCGNDKGDLYSNLKTELNAHSYIAETPRATVFAKATTQGPLSDASQI